MRASTRRVGVFLLAALMLPLSAVADSSFDMNAYTQMLSSVEGLTADGLLSRYPAGTFRESVGNLGLEDTEFGPLIDEHYALTPGENALLRRHGFVVTERHSKRSFADALTEIYHADLPVFVSTDAILHAVHMSYEDILITVEHSVMVPALREALNSLHGHLPTLVDRYSSESRMLPMLTDADVYLTVARRLLGETVEPLFPETEPVVEAILAGVKSEKPGSIPLFSNVERKIDFSQFTPRSHYTHHPTLTQYFQTMIWLGRTELYLTAPVQGNSNLKQTPEDIQRQTITAMLLVEAVEESGAIAPLRQIDDALRALVGEQDNVTLEHLRAVADEAGIKNAADLLAIVMLRRFQETLAQKEYASQHILSQILTSGDTEQIEPASAFLLVGQRFVIDSFVTGNVVFDKVSHNGNKVRRMMPSTLDVLFALGNDAAGQLLEPELRKYPYAPNLAALRYLIDLYDPDSWDESVYYGWLNAIRTLNPPKDRSIYPSFMQTGAWWQEKMNTQLASWAQLRHDNLLYAKPSYSGGAECSFPESLVEPIPEFYDAVERFADNAALNFGRILNDKPGTQEWVVKYYRGASDIASTLGDIARKELAQEPLTDNEKMFLRQMLERRDECGGGARFDGWYGRLYFGGSGSMMKPDLIVADVHTAPTDERGSPVGWVLHGGTGPINMAFVVCDMNSDEPCAYVGPVMSYRERVTTNFERLSDERWTTEHATSPTYRPPFVDLYLAGENGEPRGDANSPRLRVK
ncbi:MAG: DUF3160 domain-containing protein [Candidatus Poribacteria bacterium]|nr:DUF3160 domain-containing protein [Candidatus Poribacteria bacterium]